MNCVTTAHPAALDPRRHMTGFKHEEHVSRRPAELARVTPVDGQRDIRYGAAVYGSFLVASVVGAAFEAGARSGATPLSAVILGVGQGMLGVLLLVLESLIH